MKKQIKITHLPRVVSDGQSGRQLIRSLELSGYTVHYEGAFSESVFVATTGVQYKPILIRGEDLDGADIGRTDEDFREFALRVGFVTPPAELAPLLRRTVPDKEIKKLGLVALVIMCTPYSFKVRRSNAGCSDTIDVTGLAIRAEDGGNILSIGGMYCGNCWSDRIGFVFLAEVPVAPVV